MKMKDKIILGTEKSICYDKMQIAMAIRNSTYEDKFGCSLLNEGVLKSCEGCNLQSICELVDEVAQAYLEATTNVVETFEC